ncbi:MAG: helix-turn-helix domain-containing protein, partial [Haloechinothrix sp.]
LVTAAETTLARGGDGAAAATTAQVYNLVTRALIKLRASGLEWISADRALRAAGQAEDALTLAEAQRLLGSVFRRAGHPDRAQTLTLQAADQLDVTSRTAEPEALSLHGVLMCSAGYAAARAGDRDRAADLLGEAQSTTERLGEHPVRQRALAANVISHQVSAAYVLGDGGTALHHARGADLRSFPTAERQGRFLVDVALAFAQWNKPQQAYRVLLDAERRAPGEVRTRSAARGLVVDLLRDRRSSSLPGLRDLAVRTHALA